MSNRRTHARVILRRDAGDARLHRVAIRLVEAFDAHHLAAFVRQAGEAVNRVAVAETMSCATRVSALMIFASISAPG